MPAAKYVSLAAGVLTEVAGLDSGGEVGDAGKIVALDANGRVNADMMPVGIVPETKTVKAKGALSSGNLVNIFLDTATLSARLADCSNGRRAHGFVLAAYNDADIATVVLLEGNITGLTSRTPGAAQYLSTAGAIVEAAGIPTTPGYILQEIGYAISETEVAFEPQPPITLA
ncbi:MAG: hypothetical protein LLG20_01860 [Acidobacteriales bacterium]|nr:hypothetical protein [Terriglobales bacterium]